MKGRELTFRDVARINLARTTAWHPTGIEDWSVADWAVATAGECGEVCNAVKKLRRLDQGIEQATGPQSRAEAIADIRQEIGDTYLYLDLLAQRLGIDMAQAIAETFNRVSDREGLPFKIPVPPAC